MCVVATLFFTACEEQNNISKEEREWIEPQSKVNIPYRLISLKDSSGKKEWEQYSNEQKQIVAAVNRVDMEHIPTLDTLVVPGKFETDFMQYSPFPFGIKELRQIKKIIFFSYPAQAFGAYEYGRLVKWGPTNMGRQADQTPTGLFYANWKAKETTSTFNDEWELKWNFNIENQLGVGWHQYAMPGYPASHSCLRLYEEDAKYLYEWADQWVLEGTDDIKANGTPAVVFGAYPFGQVKPWWALADNSQALDISAATLVSLVKPGMQEILTEQEKRAVYSDKK